MSSSASTANGSLESYNKQELVGLAAGIGIEGRTTMKQGGARRRDREGVSHQALKGGTQMRVFRRKSQMQRLLDSVGDSIDVPSGD